MPRSYSKELIIDLIHQYYAALLLFKVYNIITRWIRQDNFFNHNSSTVTGEEYLKMKKI